MDRMSTVERKPTGPQFPGYWKGTDPASKAKDKMVGGAEESIIKDLHSTAKKKVTEWQLQEKYAKFKEQDSKAYTGIDPIVRQRMGMPPASWEELKSYVDKNPPAIKAGDEFLKGQHPNDVWNEPKPRMDVLSGGQMDVINAAIKAASGGPVTSAASSQPAPASVSAPATQAASSPVIKPGDSTARSSTQSGSNLPGMFNPGLPNWQNSPLNPANQPKSADSTAASTSSPTAGAAPAAAVSQSIAARDNTSSAADVSTSVFPVYKPAADGAGVVAPAAAPAPAPVRAPYRGSSSAREIQSVNPSIRDVNKIQAGQRLKLPGSDKDYIVQRGDTLDKIGKMYRSGEIGSRVVGGDGPTSTTPSRPQPAAAAQPAAPAASGPRPPIIPPGGLPTLNPPTRFDPPGRDTDTSDRPAPAARPQPAARPPSDASNPTVKLGFGDPGYTPIIGNKLEKRSDGKWYFSTVNVPVMRPDIIKHAETQLAKQRSAARPSPESQPAPQSAPSSKAPSTPSTNSSDAMASYATRGGRVYAADFNNPSGLGWDGKGKYTSYKTPEEGVNATRDLVSRYLTDQTPFIKGSPTPDQVVSTWVTGGKTPADKIQGGRYLQSVNDELAAAGVKLDAKGRIPYSQAARDAITRAIIRHETAPKHMEKFAPFLNAPKDAKGSVEESNKEDEKIAGRYDPDDFDLMVKRLGQRAREQDRKHGPVDIAALAKRLRELEKRHQTNEVEDPAVNMQDPNVQRTSQTSPQQDPAAVRQQQLDQTVDMATAKGTMTGLKNVLGPKVDTNALASAVTKISDGKPLSGPESMSMSALTPLISKAAETPQTAMALKTALSNAGMLSKQGK